MTRQATSLAEFDRDAVRQLGLQAFVQIAWPKIEPSIPYVHNWHIEEICAHLEAVSRGQISRLIINVPPGTSKSIITSVLWPLWEWTWQPGTKWMYASFDETLSVRDARRVRNLLQDPWWRSRWPEVEIPRGASESWSEFENNRGGFRFSTCIKGKATGRHANCKVIDDPHKPMKMDGTVEISQAEIQAANDWHANTWSSRNVDPKNVKEVIIMQRLHMRDLTGYLIEQWTAAGTPFEHLRLPIRFEAGNPCRTRIGGDRRTQEGEILDKQRMSDASIKQAQVDLRTERNVAAQHQQRPVPREGNTIKGHWLRHWGPCSLGCKDRQCPGPVFETLPPIADMRIESSWDLTFTGKSTSDYVCGQVWGFWRHYAILLDQIREQLTFSETLRAFERMADKWPTCWKKRVEKAANAEAMRNVLEKKIVGIDLEGPKGSKGDYLEASQPLFEAGVVIYPSPKLNPWVEVVNFSEILNFPTAPNDDTVDATTHALYQMARGSMVNIIKAVNATQREMLQAIGRTA